MTKKRKLEFDQLDTRALMSTVVPPNISHPYSVSTTLVQGSNYPQGSQSTDSKLNEFLNPH